MSKLTIVPINHDYADALLAFEKDNRAYFKSLIEDREDGFYTLHNIHNEIEKGIEEWESDEAYKFFMCVDNKLMGRINLRQITRDTHTSIFNDRQNKSANTLIHQGEIGYRISQQYSGKGVTTSAVKLVKQYAFEELHLNRIVARVAVNNPGSQIVLLKNQFQFAERIQNGQAINGQPYDLVTLFCESL
ncbi:GNAT family N-acetyltransferase [Flocculibacter collagenilyticus]|uniref:GNAT family N-acetyltransferase n=1 Tax=Flocculibacter collagenilyticus TaxID=2744479 RepID=UPI0018F783DE|nr:GNAT family N-acetyltransferase [Flocculibacter collagenilyticus]